MTRGGRVGIDIKKGRGLKSPLYNILEKFFAKIF
jgi:hypothetical protein